jgi:pimeloyl-ACP methyl ester carboxylesterase
MTSEAKPSDPSRARPALVMLHGFALDSRMWKRQVEAFSTDYRVVTVDLPGFGPQARELGEVDPAAGVLRALDVAKIDRAHLVANSFGAAVAADFALQHRDRVRSLTLSGPLLLGRRTGIEAWPRCVALAAEGDRATAAEIWLDDPLFEGLRQDEELFEELRQIVLDYGGAHWTGRVSSKWSADASPRAPRDHPGRGPPREHRASRRVERAPSRLSEETLSQVRELSRVSRGISPKPLAKCAVMRKVRAPWPPEGGSGTQKAQAF